MSEPSVVVTKVITYSWKCPACGEVNVLEAFTRFGKCIQCKSEQNLVLRSAS